MCTVFDKYSLHFIHSDLNGQKQKTKINCTDSAFPNNLFDLPQGSILGELLFDIYFCSLFFQNSHDDITSYPSENILNS